MRMTFKTLLVVVPMSLLLVGAGVANAGQTIDVAGTMACVNDKWNEQEPEKGHKLVEYAGRCVIIPTIPTHRSMSRTVQETTSICLTGVGRAAEAVLPLLRVGTRCPSPGGRDRSSRNSCARIPAAPANLRAPKAAVRTRQMNSRAPSMAAEKRATWSCPDNTGDAGSSRAMTRAVASC
jgi:hypothetical protein